MELKQTNVCYVARDTANSLHWRHNDHDGVSNHQPHGCLLNRLFRRRSKKTSKLRVTGLCVANSPGPVNSPHKGSVMRKMFPFDVVIMFSGARALPVENYSYLIQNNREFILRGTFSHTHFEWLYVYLSWKCFSTFFMNFYLHDFFGYP